VGVEPRQVEARFLVRGIGGERLLEQAPALLERALDLSRRPFSMWRASDQSMPPRAPRPLASTPSTKPRPRVLQARHLGGLLEHARLEAASAPART
jgi:hypothetical protein